MRCRPLASVSLAMASLVIVIPPAGAAEAPPDLESLKAFAPAAHDSPPSTASGT